MSLVEFASAVKAVEGALVLQKRIAEATDGVSEGKRIVLRIGINLGDANSGARPSSNRW